MIRLVTLIFFVLFINSSFGQQLNSIIGTIILPLGWTVSIEKKSSHDENFNRNIIATVTFHYPNNAVSYFFFNYKLSDSLDFSKAHMRYITQENCMTKPNKDPSTLLPTFAIKGYYFLLQHCPCQVVDRPECGDLARTLREWIKKNI